MSFGWHLFSSTLSIQWGSVFSWVLKSSTQLPPGLASKGKPCKGFKAWLRQSPGNSKALQQSMYPFEIPWVQYDTVTICNTHNIHRVHWFSLEALGWISARTINCQHQATCAATFHNVAKKVKSAWCRKPLDYTSTKRKCKKFKLAHCLDPSWGQWISKYVTSLDINWVSHLWACSLIL